MAKLNEQKKPLAMEALKERKDILERNLRIFLDRKDLSIKEARILKAVLLESIAETKEAIAELKSTDNYGKCEKKARKKKK